MQPYFADFADFADFGLYTSGTKMKLKTTIVIPCYNHNSEVARAVASALAQTDPCAVIVVDDGSETPVENFWGERVTLIRHPYNRGLSAALNTGIEAAQTERFVILAADDTLADSHAALTQDYDVDIVSVDMIANGHLVRSRAGDLETLKRSNCHSYAANVRKAMWQKVGGFKIGMDPSWEDYEFWLNCAKHGATWHHVSMPLHNYHRTSGGRDSQAQGQDTLLRGMLEGHHQDVFGQGRGVVAIIIPCYNHNQFVAAAVDSVQGQKYPHFKIVVVDDGSDVPVKLPSVPVIRQENRGLAAARNAGIKYAFENWTPQYLVMLDADDTLHPDFLSHTMTAMRHPMEFVYTDIQLIGDAWHVHQLEDFQCESLKHRHLHPCTFLAPADIDRAILARRGYIYDEHETMRIGYEDWEHSLAMMEVGACGKRLPERLFNYRFHNNGSMRTRADKLKGQLTNYIRSRHAWIMSGDKTMCSGGCGGASSYAVARTRNGNLSIQGVGEVKPGTPLQVTYTGMNESTRTKVGAHARIYKYSGRAAGPGVQYPRTFIIDAVDAGLFSGPFQIRELTAESLPTEISVASAPVAAPSFVVEELGGVRSPLTAKEVLEEVQGFDFTLLPGVGPATKAKLHAAKVVTLDQLRAKSLAELTEILGVERAAKILFEAANAYTG